MSDAAYEVIAALVNHNELKSALEVSVEHFPDYETQKLFHHSLVLLEKNKVLDFTMLCNAVIEESPQIDWRLIVEHIQFGCIGGRSNFGAYQALLKTEYVARKAKAAGQALAETGDISVAMQALRSLDVTSHDAVYLPERLVKEFMEVLEHPPETIKTGIRDLDHLLGGLHNSDLIVLGARPAMGKTAFAVNVALNCKVPFLFFSGEQPAVQLMQRIVAIDGGIPLWRLRNRSLQQTDYAQMSDSLADLMQSQFCVVDRSSPSLVDVMAETRKQQQAIGAKVVFIDYLQRMRMTNKNSRREGVEETIRGLKELARETHMPVVVLAQVNRQVDTREHKHPSMGDLLESGAIEAEADQIIMLSRPVVYDANYSDEEETLLSVAKNRHGPTGDVTLSFKAQQLRFKDRT